MSPGPIAIVVLGAGVAPDGTLGPAAQERVTKAVELYKQHTGTLLIMSGRCPFTQLSQSGPTEAHAMRDVALQLGAKESDILLEEQSTDTMGNAYYTKLLYLEPRNLHEVLVVTSRFHVDRSAYIFGKILGPAYSLTFAGAPDGLDNDPVRIEKEKRMMRLNRLFLDNVIDGDHEEVWRRLVTWHPGYSPRARITVQDLVRYSETGTLPAYLPSSL